MTVKQVGALARFAVRSGQMTTTVVKPRLLEPNRQLELSVFRIDDLGQEAIQEIGVDVVRRRPDANRLHGWAELDEAAVQLVSLTVVHDDTPPRHANIIGWPDDRAKRKLVQRKLADRASPKLVEPPVDVPGGNRL